MRRLGPAATLLAAGLSILGCDGSDSGIQEPPVCPAPCRARVAYLRLDSVVIISPTTPSFNNLPLVQPGDARVAYAVTNIGDTMSGRVPVFIDYLTGHVQDTLPPLAPGQRVLRPVTLDYSAAGVFRSADVGGVRVLVLAPPDSVKSSSSMESPEFRVAIPLLSIQATLDSASIRVGRPLAGQSRVVNSSRYAASPAFRMAGCLSDGFRFCYPDTRTTFGDWDIPALPPQTSFAFASSILIPAAAAWQDEDMTYRANFCRLPAGHSDPYLDPYLPGAGKRCDETFSLHVLPDYERSCQPPLLAIGRSHVFTAYNCGIRPATTLVDEWSWPGDTELGRFHLVAIDAAAGATYRFTRSAGTQPLRFYDADGFTQDDLDPAGDRIRFAESGRKYVALYTPQASLTVSLGAQ